MRRLAPTLLVVATLALAACAAPKPPAASSSSAAAAATSSTASVPLEGLAAILRAEDRRVPDPDLDEALRAVDPATRARAALAVARIGGPGALPRLETALADEEASVRAIAAFGLGLLGDPSSTPILLRAAEDPAPWVRARAMDALGRLAAADAAGAVLDGFLDPEPEVRAEAAFASWKLPDPSPFLDRLAAGLADADPIARFGCAYALARLGAAGSAPPSSGPQPGKLDAAGRAKARSILTTLVGSRELEFRLQVARGLSSPAGSAEDAALGALRDDPVPGVRVQVARAVAFPGAPLATHLLKLLKDQDPTVVRAAVEGLGRVKTPDATQYLLDGLRRETRAWILDAAIEALVEAYPTFAPPLLEELSTQPEASLRARVAGFLVRFDAPEAEALARTLFRDAAGSVRAAAFASLARKEPIGGPAWESAAADPDPVVRAAAATAAGSTLRKAGISEADRGTLLKLLREVQRRSSADDLPDARLAVVEAASRVAELPQARSILETALGSNDWLARRAAAAAWKTAYGEDRSDRIGAASDRPDEEYRKIAAWASKPRAAIFLMERRGFAPARFTARLHVDDAPLAAWNFAKLAEAGFFDGLSIHRVVPNFVVQDGDPRGDGFGGPGYTIRDEIAPRRFWAGTLGMASSGPDTAGSQWFVTLSAQPHLDGRYTAFGSVVQNFEGLVARILPDDRVVSVRVYEGDGSEPLPPLDP